MKEQEIICINCPLACRVNLKVDDKGEVVEVSGHQCKQGRAYAIQEFKSPMRILTTTVPTRGSVRPLLPVRSNKPLPKGALIEAMRLLATMEVSPPIKLGEVLSSNILNSKADLIACDDLLM
jgi:CxxC motif-containing protein